MTWVVVIVVGYVALNVLILIDIDVMTRRAERLDPFEGTRREIRSLPETQDAPFDWELEDAA